MTYAPKKHVRDHSELVEAVRQVAALARAERQQPMLVGGLAMQLYGSPRLTGDIDIVVTRPICALTADKELSFGGYQSTTPNNVPIDVIIRSDEWASLYDTALNNRTSVQGLPMCVVRPEYLVAMKMVAGRNRDEADFDFLVTDGPIDLNKTLKIIRKFLGPYGAQDFRARVDEAKWKKEAGRL